MGKSSLNVMNNGDTMQENNHTMILTFVQNLKCYKIKKLK